MRDATVSDFFLKNRGGGGGNAGVGRVRWGLEKVFFI